VGSGVVSAGNGLVALEASVGSGNGGTGVGSVVAGAVVVGASRDSKAASGSSGDGADFRVTVASGAVSLAALPELHAGALGVAVVGTGAESLLLLVVLHKEDLEEGAKEEQESADDGDGEAGSVELAGCAERRRVGNLVALTVGAEAFLGVGGTITKRSLDTTGAAGCAIAGKNGDGDHGAAAKDIKEYAEESEDFLQICLVKFDVLEAKNVLTFPPRKQVNRTAKMV
jgi:hypothetical protein